MLKKFPLGRTSYHVSPLGLGTVKFGRTQGLKYPQSFELPDDQTIKELLACARDLGINLIDTAPAYGSSEERLGVLLKAERKEWVIVTKVGEEFVNGESQFDFSPQHTRYSIERSLKRLQTDHLDIVLVHSNGDDVRIIEEEGILETLTELKKEGLIGAFGMSTKTVEGGKLAVERSDVVMVTYQPDYLDELPVIIHAHQYQTGVLIKKALSSGHLRSGADEVTERMGFIFQQRGVSSVIVGTLNPTHLRENALAVEQYCA